MPNAGVRRGGACDLPRDNALHERVARHGILKVERVLVPSNEKAIYFFLGPETLGNNLAIW